MAGTVDSSSNGPDVGQVAIANEDDRSSLSSGDAQTGVKGIEAISQTWTQWSLIAAYLG